MNLGRELKSIPYGREFHEFTTRSLKKLALVRDSSTVILRHQERFMHVLFFSISWDIFDTNPLRQNGINLSLGNSITGDGVISETATASTDLDIRLLSD